MIVEITLLILGGLGNLAWDLTGRRVSARARRQARLARRRDSLPLPAADESATDPFVGIAAVAPPAFVEQTRVIVEELDRVVDHFDLVLLRAEAAESLISDVVYIGGEIPRERGRELLRSWLEAVDGLASDSLDRLRDLGLPDLAVREVWERELQRSHWPNAATSTELLDATAVDFEAAVGLLVGFLRTLGQGSGDPYR
ncbi:MAG TPA: hypothetical protein VK034_15375 [Enhygromyxa sp.]|nr:hypothetical protein [Enhygromyxa sp.]